MEIKRSQRPIFYRVHLIWYKISCKHIKVYMINKVKSIIIIKIIMSSLSEKVTSFVTNPLTGIVSGVY